jgi:peptidase E
MDPEQTPVRKIFALGNADAQDDAINTYVIGLAGKTRPMVCFLGTASGDDPGYVQIFTYGFSRLPCVTKSLSLFRLPTDDLRGYLLDADIIYVGGGNTRNMLAVWREWGVDDILREAWELGIVLCGPSAGANCWFEQATTDSVPGQINPVTCLGFLPGSCCPHYDSEPLRRPSYLKMVQDGVLNDGYALDDFVGLLFQGTELTDVVSARRGSYAYHVERKDGRAVETLLKPTVALSP